MDLNEAITKHAEWKLKFRKAISGHETMDAATISKDNCCELGKWLHGEAKTKFAGMAAHSECLKSHATFHVEAGQIAKTINEKKFDAAEAMLGSGTGYDSATRAVGLAIMRLKKEAGL